MKYIVERTVKYDDGKVQTLYITKMTLFGTFFGPRQNAMVFHDEDAARRIILQSRKSDREIYTAIPLSGDVENTNL